MSSVMVPLAQSNLGTIVVVVLNRLVLNYLEVLISIHRIHIFVKKKH